MTTFDRLSRSTFQVKTPLDEAVVLEVTTPEYRSVRPHRHLKVSVTRRYAITLAIVVEYDSAKLPHIGLYGYSVRRDGTTYGLEHPINFHFDSVVRSAS